MAEIGVQKINDMTSDEAQDVFEACCGSIRWASSMIRERPFLEAEDLHHSADRIWGVIRDDDRKEAFTAHPRIGDVESLRSKFGRSDWAEGEQSGIESASNETLMALAKANLQYEEQFGYIFIICATGKSADDILVDIVSRLNNDSSVEFREASEQQRQIIHVRIGKLLIELEENEHSFR